MYLDLDELDTVLGLNRWFSAKRWSPLQFQRRDYLAGSDDLKTAVHDRVEAQLGFRPSGAVRLLTNIRYFGFVINPISAYYCFDTEEQLVALVAEVTNTPWDKRIAYVLPTDPSKAKQRIEFAKALHVSPFMPMDMVYHWFSNTPQQALNIHIQNRQQTEIRFDATLTLRRTEFSRAAITRHICRFPLMTMKVVAAIYWQALRLIAKRVALHPYPKISSPSSSSSLSIGAHRDY